MIEDASQEFFSTDIIMNICTPRHIHTQTHRYTCMHMHMQPIAFGVSFNIDLQSQLIGLFSTERGQRDLEN